MRVLALLAFLTLLSPVSPKLAVPGGDLTDAVAALLPARDGAVDTQVNVLREDPGGWAFGTAVRVAPAAEDAYPDGWLWIAHDQEGWRVGLEGSPAFAELSARAPVLAPVERQTLAGLDGATQQPDGTAEEPDGTAAESARATDYRTGMRLPYAVGQKWRYTGGPHPMGGNPRSSIDLAGGDGRVRAARAGLAYTMCGSGKGWLRVVHDRGFATDYYHLRDNIRANGRRVAEGSFLGKIGNDVSCGGSSSGRHVHFSLRRHGAYVAINRYSFGKWSIRSGTRPYQGSAWHGSTRVGVDGLLRNYGALGLTQGVVDTNGGGVLHRRAGPGTKYEIVGKVRDGATVKVRCSARGTTHTGRSGYRTNLWNQLSNGTWVSDAFLWTGTGDPVNGRC